MFDGDQIFRRADMAVRDSIIADWPHLKGRWRPVAPKNLLDKDNWILRAQTIVAAFGQSIGEEITMSDAECASYHEQRLIEFVVALANLGDASQRRLFKTKFVEAGL